MTGDADDDGDDTDTATTAVTPVTDAATLAADSGHESRVLDTETVWETPYFAAGYDVVEHADGTRNRWYWVDPADVVAVVAETDAGEVVIVEQADGRLGESLLTCPGGGVEDGESAVEAGVRELREETGFRADSAELVTTYYPSAWLRMEQAVVYATDLEPGPPDHETGEFIDVYTAPPDVALEAVSARDPAFGPGLASLLLAREAGLLSSDGVLSGDD